jgi:uncharacterized cupredoxin-like copper-binding protein
MKKAILLTVFVLVAFIGFSQFNYKFNYQAVVRNGAGALVPNGANVSFRRLAGATFHLTDANGKLLAITNNELEPGKYWRLQMSETVAGNYLLILTADGNHGSFTITHLAQ